MKKISLMLFGLLMMVSMAQAAIKLVATLPWIGSITRELGGDNVQVTVLVKPSQDPHMIDAKPSFILAARQADAILFNGLDLEIGYLPRFIESSRNVKLQPGQLGNFDCSRFVTVVEKPAAVDRSLGDVHPLGNPHYQFSPANIQHVAEGIAGLLAQLDDAHKEYYHSRLKIFLEKMQAHRAQWAALPLKGRKFVAYHKLYEYLVPEFGIQVIGYLEPKPGISPSASHIEQLLADMKMQRPYAIIISPYEPMNEANYLSAQSGVKVSVLPHEVGSLPGTDDWFAFEDKIMEGLQ
jgi:zinc/manganese transport system substrate-binding protein